MAESSRALVVAPEFLDDLRYWLDRNPRLAARVLALVQAVSRDPFTGIGKPERLRRVDADTWSRRIDREHRLIYLVLADSIVSLTARRHYTDH